MSMQKPPSSTPKGAFGVQDVIFVLFKHKWMILLFSIIGLGAATGVFMTQKAEYKSQAKLLIRYVLQRGSVDPYTAQASPGGMPGTVDPVISTEIEILNSVDLALDVAEAVGLDRLLPDSGGKARLSDGAGVVLGGLAVGVIGSPNVLHLDYSNEDPELSKIVLKELMNCYFNKHLQIHRSAANFDLVAKQTEEVRERLRKTEAELNKLRTESGIVSLDDATESLAGQKSKMQADLMAAKATLAEQQANIEFLQKDIDAGQAEEEKNKAKAGVEVADKKEAAVPPQVVAEYRTATEMLALLRRRDMELRIRFTDGNRLVILNRQQISEYDTRLRGLLERYPGLEEEVELAEREATGTKPSLVLEKARLESTMARIRFYEENLKLLGEQFSEQYAIGARIQELDRRRGMEEAEYRSLETSLKNAKLDQTLDPARMPNITVVQQPSEPIKSFDEKIKKLALGLAGGGMALGLGLAFLIELLLDRRVKRPIEIQARLQLPLLLSIPFIRRKERGGLLLANQSNQPRIGMGGDSLIVADGKEELAIEKAPRKTGHFILPYSETIRDRIIFNFEINNITHKPKLVAVAGLSEGAGASTIAAGLAKSFSEIPGIKVLLVDLSSFHPEDNPLFGEIPRHSLNGALHLARNTKFRENPQNLYYASANARRDDTGLTTFSPVHLYELMPHLQASEYDYIVFDMPTLDQTSRTLTMAGLMDKVLLVLDAENTSRDSLMWGYSELVKGRADVSCVFNKMKSPVPGWLAGGEN